MEDQEPVPPHTWTSNLLPLLDCSLAPPTDGHRAPEAQGILGKSGLNISFEACDNDGFGSIVNRVSYYSTNQRKSAVDGSSRVMFSRGL